MLKGSAIMELASLIITGIVLIWTLVSFFLLNRQNVKMQEIQAELNRKNEISKIQFETEFGIFKELTQKLIILQQDAFLLFPRGLISVPREKDERKKYQVDNYEKAAKTYNEFNLILAGYAPFITEHYFNIFDDIRQKIQYQLNWYPDLKLEESDPETQKEYREVKKKCGKITDEINVLREQLISELRDYFSTTIK